MYIFPRLVLRNKRTQTKYYLISFVDASTKAYSTTSTKTLETFVENRLKDLRKSKIKFRHILSTENPTDIGTRESTINDLQINILLFNGPKFLAENEDNWPLSKIKFSTPINRSVLTLPIIHEEI